MNELFSQGFLEIDNPILTHCLCHRDIFKVDPMEAGGNEYFAKPRSEDFFHRERCIHGLPQGGKWKRLGACHICNSLTQTRLEPLKLYLNVSEIRFSCNDKCGLQCPFYTRCLDEKPKKSFALLQHWGYFKGKRGSGKTNWTQELKRTGYRSLEDYTLRFEPFADPIFSYRFSTVQFNIRKERFRLIPHLGMLAMEIFLPGVLEYRLTDRLYHTPRIVQDVYNWHLGDEWPKDELWNIEYKSGAKNSKVRFSIEPSNVFPSLGRLYEEDDNGESVYYRDKGDIENLRKTILEFGKGKGWRLPRNINSKINFRDKDLLKPIEWWANHGAWIDKVEFTDGTNGWPDKISETKFILWPDLKRVKPFWGNPKNPLRSWKPPDESQPVKPMWAFVLYEFGSNSNATNDETEEPTSLSDDILDKKIDGIELEDRFRYSFGIPQKCQVNTKAFVRKSPLYPFGLSHLALIKTKHFKRTIFVVNQSNPSIKQLIKTEGYDPGWNWLFEEDFDASEGDLHYRSPALWNSPKHQPDLFDLIAVFRYLRFEKLTKPKTLKQLRSLIYRGAFKGDFGTIDRERYESEFEESLEEFDELPGEQEQSRDNLEPEYEYFPVDDWESWHGNCDDPAEKSTAKRRQLKPLHFENESEDKIIEELDWEHLSLSEKIEHFWHQGPDQKEREIAAILNCSHVYVKKIIDSLTNPKILKELEKTLIKDQKRSVLGTIYREEEQMGPREKRLRMGKIKREKPERMSLMVTPECKAVLSSLMHPGKIDTYSEALQQLAGIGMNWGELRKHFPNLDDLQDVKDFSSNLTKLLKLTSVHINTQKKENEGLKKWLRVYEGILDRETPGRVAMLKRTYVTIAEKQSDHRQAIKDGVVPVWKGASEKVKIEVEAPPEKESKEDYRKRIEDVKKWGGKTE